MKKVFYHLALIVMTLILSSCGDKPSESKGEQTGKIDQNQSANKENQKCELTMGWDPWEPYQYLTPDNQVQGLEIDLINSIAKQAGCKVKFVQDDWMKLLAGIKSGKVDLLGGASRTSGREKFASFSSPYRHESFVLYVRTGDVEKYSGKSLTELLDNEFRLGVTESYIYGHDVSGIQDNEAYSSQLVTVPVTEVNYYNLTQNQIDGFLEDPFVAGYTIKRKGLIGQISASTTVVHSGDVSILFSKTSVKPEIVHAFNKGIESIKASGEYQKILNKYWLVNLTQSD